VKEWLIRKGPGAFSHLWATPFIHYAYCPICDRVYVALNEEYQIYVYDMKGRLIQTIERPHERVSVNTKDKELIMGWALRNESLRWAVDAFPDTLAAIRGMGVLPKGYLAVYRIVGSKEIEIDVYEPGGKLVYIMKLPEGITIDEKAIFYDFGFATQTTRDEFPVYCEFRIMNIPEIFTYQLNSSSKDDV
jgi:hypothetical protein